MFKIESYVTPILLSYVDKYVRDFKPADAQVSLWGGGVALHNLVLKPDVLQQEVSLPFTLVSGRIHELLIHVPWTKIMSEPIIVTIDTIECVLSLNPPSTDEGPPQEVPIHKPQVVEAPPGYMQALVRRIVTNIALRVHHLIVKYVQDDIVLSLNVKHLSVDSTGADWKPSFADIDQHKPIIRRVVKLDDLTLCLDRADSDGRIRFYQEPLLYRCQLDLRVLTRLVSANTRRASCLNVQLRSSKLAWGVTNDQLVLLLRLLTECNTVDPNPMSTTKTAMIPTLHHASSLNSAAEPTRNESWAEWAWSWLPTWSDRPDGVELATMPFAPTPLYFNAYFDIVSVAFKVMEVEVGSRKRARSVLELSASHAAIKSYLCKPTTLTFKVGVRALVLKSQGKCVCGHVDLSSLKEEATIYLEKQNIAKNEDKWDWPEEDFDDTKIETAEAVDETYTEPQTNEDIQEPIQVTSNISAESHYSKKEFTSDIHKTFWEKMEPLLSLEFTHERSPPVPNVSPYENIPIDFQYSDWQEECKLDISVQPLVLRLNMGLIHRIAALKSIFNELQPSSDTELPPMRVLTVEECEALQENLPQRCLNIEIKDLRLRLFPYDHSLSEKPTKPPLVLDIEVPGVDLVITTPLYPHRVCSAACQMPDKTSPVWQAARLHVSAVFTSIEVKITSPSSTQSKPCARCELQFVTHVLLNQQFFDKETPTFSYSIKMREANISGSAARLQAAYQVVISLLNQSLSLPLWYTSLSKDVLKDEESVALDMTLEDFSMRGFITTNTHTHIGTLQSARITAFHSPKEGVLKQAWVFSAPDVPTATHCFRIATQWCWEPHPHTVEYIGIWTEPSAVCIDPLFLAWLGYKPRTKTIIVDLQSASPATKTISSTQYFMRRRSTPPSSSGRGGSRSGSGAELIHLRQRSVESSSEPSEKKEPKQPAQSGKTKDSLPSRGESLLKLHSRFRYVLITVEVGQVLLYVTTTSASALDCSSVRVAMEQHAANSHSVFVISIGSWIIHSSAMTKELWQDIAADGPTFIADFRHKDIDSFPWKMSFTEVSCYSLEVLSGDRSGRENATGLRSQLKLTHVPHPRLILELVTTKVTLSVVTKSQQYKTFLRRPHQPKAPSEPEEDQKTKYFTTGASFEPSTLKEFVRGPARRRKSTNTTEEKQEIQTEPETISKTTKGPIVSVGINLHADTPPIIVRLDHDQVHLIAAAMHCFTHLVTLLTRPPLVLDKRYPSSQILGGRAVIKSVCELDEQQSTVESGESDNKSELVSLFQAHPEQEKDPNITKFFWFQWVISRATLIISTRDVKLALLVEDIISSIDLQHHYNQIKIKIGTAALKHYEKNENNEFVAGPLGGRILEAREPDNVREETNFLSVTITQARISNLPDSWKEELHPKLLEQSECTDSMWEVYAMLAPLEAVLQPAVLENIISVAQELSSRSFCPLQTEVKRRSTWQWPFCYITAGGLRLLVTSECPEKNVDDTFEIVLQKISVNPHPENPICRRSINTGAETGWMTVGGGYDGRQYEILVKNIEVRSGLFTEIVLHEEMVSDSGIVGENPARKWSQPVITPNITVVVHPVDVNCVLAPALYIGGSLVCGAAVEINLLSDCSVELSIDQLELIRRIIVNITNSLQDCQFSSPSNDNVCPYAPFLMIEYADDSASDSIISEGEMTKAEDSGVDTFTSRSTLKTARIVDDTPVTKKSVSLALFEVTADPKEYLEVFVTMGTIELSLYVEDDKSATVRALRPEGFTGQSSTESPPSEATTPQQSKRPSLVTDKKIDTIFLTSKGMADVRDLTEKRLELLNVLPQSPRRSHKYIPLFHVTLQQPNLYFWRKKMQKTIQISLFDIWMALGTGRQEEWHKVLLSTARGVPDPVTEIPPALATLKLLIPSAGSTYLGSSASFNIRGTLQIDIERPLLIEVCGDRVRRLKAILDLVDDKISATSSNAPERTQLSLLYKIRRFMVKNSIDVATFQMSQLGVTGFEGAMGWDSASMQVAWGIRPERLVVRSLVTAAFIAAGPPNESRRSVLQPLHLGAEVDASWEAWRRAESMMLSRDPTVHMVVELDRVILDLRPSDLAAVNRMQDILNESLEKNKNSTLESKINSCTSILSQDVLEISSITFQHRNSASSTDSNETDHYYKDDLRSGAFKIVRGGQLPMAYQVLLYEDAVSWRYPHPRAITRLVAFPLPEQNEEIECVLEMHNRMLQRWEPHTYINLPVNEPREIQLYVAPPEAVFATTWRFRVCPKTPEATTFEFNMFKFLPKMEPLITEAQSEDEPHVHTGKVTAEQLSGVLRVDSYFAPRLLPQLCLTVQLTALEIHIHNSMPTHSSQSTKLEGYYVSRPQMQSHRVLTLNSNESTVHAEMGSVAGILLLLNTRLSSNVLDCTTGILESLIDEFRVQAGLSLAGGKFDFPRLRFRTSDIHMDLHVPRMRTIQVLIENWKEVLREHLKELSSQSEQSTEIIKTKPNLDISFLEGHISLWLHNNCSAPLRAGQEGTDEVLLLEPGVKLAYRWRSPTATKRIRFALANPSAEWHWSNSVPFKISNCRIRIEGSESVGSSFDKSSSGLYLHVNVENTGSSMCMRLSGKLSLANMLRLSLQYKVRSRIMEQNTWHTLSSSELSPEAIGKSVLCGANCEMVLKIRFTNHETGWSGDIPLKECPKQNVPWLVKVPSEGDMPYISVWCRVVRGRNDGRILATIWPLYVLHCNLPLDTDVLIATETSLSSSELPSAELVKPAPLIQSALGRGASTHLLAPGTTSARHTLSFQYRNIECPVTHDAVPMHYGVTDTSVFDKYVPINNIEEVIQEIDGWLERCGRSSKSLWPYSLVSKHWPGTWQPALLQPRCDVTVRYKAVRAGGGCCLEILLSPVVLLSNASPTSLTLRAHDAAPMCKLEPGTAISPSTAILKKPFFLSIEMGRETFVSGQLEISSSEPGRYTMPPPGQIALDHPADIAIQCNQQVTLLTMYYEIKEEINVIGLTSTFTLINRLNTDIMVSAVATAGDVNRDIKCNPKTFKRIPPPKSEGNINYKPLCRFWLRSRWRGGDVATIGKFLYLALPSNEGTGPSHDPVPIRLGKPPVRRALALVDVNQRSVPVVVTQHKHEGRWVVTVADDPCPQFLVHNRTRYSVAIGQPVKTASDADSTTFVRVVADCSGAQWCCIVDPDAILHYSTPAYCALHPNSSDASSTVPYLTFCRIREKLEPDWCAPTAIADGEQLVQLYNKTVKLRVRSHPHSTLVELQEVEENDISASDIRRRLVGPFNTSDVTLQSNETNSQIAIEMTNSGKLERVAAEDKLLETSAQLPKKMQTGVTIQIYSETSLLPANAAMNPGYSELNENLSEPILVEERNDDASIGVVESDISSHRELQAVPSELTIAKPILSSEISSMVFKEGDEPVSEMIRGIVASIGVKMSSTSNELPLVALHVNRAALLISSHSTRVKTTVSIADIQVDNLQYESGQFDFAVVATTRSDSVPADRWPALWNMFAEQTAFSTRKTDARVFLGACHDKWTVATLNYTELTELDVRLGPIALYVEDTYVKALIELFRMVVPLQRMTDTESILGEARAIQNPLRLRSLYLHPLDLTLTLHTAVRMYIALDQSPLHLSAFKLRNMMTSSERLAHALTVHYLSAAILGAGWVVGGLELLGAPGALAARVGGATGGVRGIASAAAAALLRSLSAWASSLARNLDLLAGDEEHARRAAAARRHPPDSFVAGLAAGITNFAINILGAVGGLAHHPLLSIAVGETESGATALRRGLIGALTKPLSATADLVAYAGNGLLKQTGWDPVPQPRAIWSMSTRPSPGWKRDCVRWSFRLAELTVLGGYEVLLNNAPLQLLLTHKFIVVTDPETENVVEMIDLRFCSLSSYQGSVIELSVSQRRPTKAPEQQNKDEDDEFHISEAAMARVARYTGAEGAENNEVRVLNILAAPAHAHSLYAMLAAIIHNNSPSYFSLL